MGGVDYFACDECGAILHDAMDEPQDYGKLEIINPVEGKVESFALCAECLSEYLIGKLILVEGMENEVTWENWVSVYKQYKFGPWKYNRESIQDQIHNKKLQVVKLASEIDILKQCLQ